MDDNSEITFPYNNPCFYALKSQQRLSKLLGKVVTVCPASSHIIQGITFPPPSQESVTVFQLATIAWTPVAPVKCEWHKYEPAPPFSPPLRPCLCPHTHYPIYSGRADVFATSMMHLVCNTYTLSPLFPAASSQNPKIFIHICNMYRRVNLPYGLTVVGGRLVGWLVGLYVIIS